MTSGSSTPTQGARTIFAHRLLLVARASVAFGGLLALVLFLAALFSGQAVVGRAAMIALSTSVLGQAVSQACGAWWLWRSASWRGLGGERVSRDQRPGRFKAWLTMHIVLGGIYSALAVFLTGIAVGSWP